MMIAEEDIFGVGATLFSNLRSCECDTSSIFATLKSYIKEQSHSPAKNTTLYF
jgi:hypothetical protein